MVAYNTDRSWAVQLVVRSGRVQWSSPCRSNRPLIVRSRITRRRGLALRTSCTRDVMMMMMMMIFNCLDFNVRSVANVDESVQISFVPVTCLIDEKITHHIYRVAQKTGPPYLIANILKFRDRIAWKLVNFCNIICWTQSLTFCLKISSRCGVT